MRDIQIALDMRPGSIYAGFGSKEGLFAEVLSAYVSSTRIQLERIAATGSPLTTFKDFLLMMVNGKGARHYQQQCLLVRSLSELQNHDIEARTLLLKGLADVEKGFIRILESAKKRNELPANYDCEQAASWLQQQVMGLRAYSAIGNPQFSAVSGVDTIIALLPGLFAHHSDIRPSH